MPGQNDNNYELASTRDQWKMEQNLLKQEKEDKWAIWVNQNRHQITNLFLRWTGHRPTNRDLTALARGTGGGAQRLYNQVNEFLKLEQYLPAFHSYNGRNMTLAEGRKIMKTFVNAPEYENWLKAGEQAKTIMSSVNELYSAQGLDAPTQNQVQGYLAGRKGGDTFQAKYDAMKAAKDAAFKPVQSTQSAQNQQTGLTQTPALDTNFEY